MVAKTPVTQRSPCYSVVSALLNPLPDCSNYSPLLPHPLPLRINTLLVPSGNTLCQAAPLETNTYCCSALLQNLVWDSGEMQCLEKLNNKQRQVWMFLILLFKFLTQFPFVSFISISFLSLLPFSILSTISSFSSDQFFVLLPPKIMTSSFITFCFTNDTYFCILRHIF